MRDSIQVLIYKMIYTKYEHEFTCLKNVENLHVFLWTYKKINFSVQCKLTCGIEAVLTWDIFISCNSSFQFFPIAKAIFHWNFYLLNSWRPLVFVLVISLYEIKRPVTELETLSMMLHSTFYSLFLPCKFFCLGLKKILNWDSPQILSCGRIRGKFEIFMYPTPDLMNGRANNHYRWKKI